MARKPRFEAPGAIHHVVANGNGGQAIVRDDLDRRAFLARLARTVDSHEWVCLAYCLMDTHFHLVVETPEPNLGVGMQWLKATYAQDFNYRHGRRGHVFGGRFYSTGIEHGAHLVAAIVYVALNPVRAGLVDDPARWSCSSYAATAGLAPVPTFLAADRVLEIIDARPRVARRLFAAAVRDGARELKFGADAPGVRPMGSDPGSEVGPVV